MGTLVKPRTMFQINLLWKLHKLQVTSACQCLQSLLSELVVGRVLLDCVVRQFFVLGYVPLAGNVLVDRGVLRFFFLQLVLDIGLGGNLEVGLLRVDLVRHIRVVAVVGAASAEASH